MIVFRTPGSMDMRSFTTMGLTAKPNTTRPIGLFGTGLKYAIAVLTRLGAQIEVYSNGQRYWFETVPIKFRDSDFQQITMRRDNWTGGRGWVYGRRLKLPFTTQYGRNWEPWMAFRELYSNTLDEGGDIFQWDHDRQPDEGINRWGMIESGKETVIIVSNCPAFEEAYEKRDEIFLDLSTRKVLGETPAVEIREGEAKNLFYQGLRAKDIDKPALYTYNFLTAQNLTEDRQLAHDWRLQSTLANTVAQMDDEQLIEKIITAKEENWEHGLTPDSWITPSQAFRNVMARRPRGIGLGFSGFYNRHDDRPEIVRQNLWKDALRPWKADKYAIQSADDKELFRRPGEMNETVWTNLATALLEIANGSFKEVVESGEEIQYDEPF